MQMLRLNSVYLYFIIFCFYQFFIYGCEGKSNLSRSKAEALIENSQIEIKQKIGLNENGIQIGLQHDFWYQKKSYIITNLMLTKKGDFYFKNIDNDYITLNNPIDIKVEVNGITDAVLPLTNSAGVKEAQFIWHYINMPSQIKWVCGDGGKGKAYFRYYDDGWRLEALSDVFYSRNAIQLSSSELNEEELERISIKENKEKLQRIEAERKMKEEERISQLIKESKKPTETIGTFRCINSLIGMGQRPQANGEALLTDVDASYTHSFKNSVQSVSNVDVVFWFGNIKSIYVTDLQDNPKAPPNAYKIGFKLKKEITIGAGFRIDGIMFQDKKIRDDFYKKVMEAKFQWDKKYQELK